MQLVPPSSRGVRLSCAAPSRALRRVAVLLATLTCGACTQGSGDETAQDDLGIVGGKKVTSSDPIAKVAVAIVDAEVGEYCTGVVLDSLHVVSASHCFDDESRTPNVRVGAGSSGELLAVRSVAVHAKSSKARRDAYDATIEDATSADEIPAPSAPLYDVAVLELAQPLPSTVRPAEFAGDEDLSSATLATAGFGCRSTVCKSVVDTLHKVELRFVKTVPAANVVVLTSGGRKGACVGDSGGPDYVVTEAGAVKVFGLVMTGPASCEAGISVDTLVAPYLDWIRSTAAQMGKIDSGASTSSYRLTVY